jgi:RimJ/RimL family protein N-acetyltransferase
MSNASASSQRPDVRLAPLGSEHAEDMFRWMMDPDISSNLGLRTEPSIEKTRRWLRAAMDNPQMRAYAILFEGRHVGNVVLDRLDSHLANARLSIYIGESEARGRGVGSAALRLGLIEAFHGLALHKVWLIAHISNIGAVRAYLKAGFVMEGILRDEFRLRGQLIPAFYMGILREEFERLETPRSTAESNST